MAAKTMRELTADTAPALTRLIATQAPTGSTEPTKSTLSQLFAMSGAGGLAAGTLGFNVMDYGAVPNNDTINNGPAFQAAFDAAVAAGHGSNEVGATPGGASWVDTNQGVFVPPGIYYMSTGITKGTGDVIFYTNAPGTATIKLTASIYFITMTGYVANTYVHGLNFVAGKGALKYSQGIDNVLGKHVVSNCHFSNFTECAIGHTNPDMPYWLILFNTFYGTSTSISVALGGNADNCLIMANSFVNGKYGLKIGDRLSGNIDIRDNDFIAFNASVRAADIWLVPNTTDASATNSGWGTEISNNKFGNENLGTEPRILIAMEGAGADRLVRHHSTTASASVSDEFLSGIIIRHNRISASGTGTAPVIYSYVQAIMGLDYSDNLHDGGTYTYCLEMNASAIPTNDGYPHYFMRWHYKRGYDDPTTKPFSLGLSNARRFLGEWDPTGTTVYDEMAQPGIGDGGCTMLAADPGIGVSVSLASAPAAATVGDNGQGAEITLTDPAGAAYKLLNGTTPTAGRYSWAEVTVASGASLSLTSVRFLLRGNSGITGWEITIPLTTQPKTVRVPFIFPTNTSQGSWLVVVETSDYLLATRTKFRISNLAVYHSKAPLLVHNRMGSGLFLNYIRDAAPASSTAAGTKGERYVHTDGTEYNCVATNTWVRRAVAGTATGTF